MLYGKTGDTVHDGSRMTWAPLIYLHEELNKKNSNGQRRRKCFCLIDSLMFDIFLFHTSYSSTFVKEVDGRASVSDIIGVVTSSFGHNHLQ